MTVPRGYRFSALYAGIRKSPKPDLSLIVSDTPAAGAAMYTTNKMQAAPVRLSRKHMRLSKNVVRALLINAGNANCATRTGDAVALATARAAAAELAVPVTQVLPSSTGVIGVELDERLILNAMPDLVAGLGEERFLEVADAIMTTDTFRKVAQANHQGIRIAGMTKGAGMIQPNMATTLGYVLTDAVLTPAQCDKLLRACVERSYHRITVDGDTSTNDTVVLLANGASGKKPAAGFEEKLARVFEDLARQIARDGEGATKLITIDVVGARTNEDAVRMARAIANSPLVKTAVAGSDPNWGRIVCAAGYAGARFDPAKATVKLQGVTVCRNGLAAPMDEDALKTKLDAPDVRIELKTGTGPGRARFWTCDFTEGYIRINGSYRT